MTVQLPINYKWVRVIDPFLFAFFYSVSPFLLSLFLLIVLLTTPGEQPYNSIHHRREFGIRKALMVVRVEFLYATLQSSIWILHSVYSTVVSLLSRRFESGVGVRFDEMR